MTDKTHYRKAFNSPYLSSADIVGPTILTVKYVVLEIDRTKKTKDYFNTAHFVERELRPGEPLKPMILNATNSRVMRDLTDSYFLEDWQNVPVTIYVQQDVKFGRETTEGLRISPQPPQVQRREVLPNTPQWENAKAAYLRDGNFDAVLARVHLSEENQIKMIEELQAAQQ